MTKMEPALILGLCRVVVLAWLSLIIKPPPFTHTQVGCNTIICRMTFFGQGLVKAAGDLSLRLLG